LVDSVDLIDRLSAYGIYIKDDRVILIKDPRSLRWELPGGGVEKGENVREGLAREFTEEAGVTISGPIRLTAEWTEYFFDIPTNQAWRSKRQFYTVSRIKGNLLVVGNNDDSAATELIPLNQINSLDIAPKIREVINQATSLYAITSNQIRQKRHGQ
jgi:8-oxo-dGTP pyrophosphatase MutT (NUDIX family)